MDINKAINYLEDSKCDQKQGEVYQEYHNSVLEMAIESLKKQIPTKPIMKMWSPALCPSCKIELSESLGDGYYKHYYSKTICECGQKLEWGDRD